MVFLIIRDALFRRDRMFPITFFAVYVTGTTVGPPGCGEAALAGHTHTGSHGSQLPI